MVVELLKKPGAGLKRNSKSKDTEDVQASGKKAVGRKAAEKKTTGKKVASRKAAGKKAGASKRSAKSTVVADAAKAAKSAATKQQKKKTAARHSAQEQAKASGPGKRNADGDAHASGPDPGGPEGDPFEAARKKMKGSVPAIVEAMVKEAKKGSCSHAKTLLEMTGVRHLFDEETRPKGFSESWAKRVLKRMEEAEEQDRRKALPEEAAKQ